MTSPSKTYQIFTISLMMGIFALHGDQIHCYKIGGSGESSGTYRYSGLSEKDIGRLLKIDSSEISLVNTTELTHQDIIKYFGRQGYRNYKSMGVINLTKKDLTKLQMKKAPGVKPRLDGDPMKVMIASYALRRNLDPDFVFAVIRTESNFNPQAVSHKGAIGLMQIMPETASMVAKREITETDLKNPIINLSIGTYHLRDLLARYRNPITALSAWNAGEGAVKKYGAIPPYQETINFDAQVMNHYRNYKKDKKWKK